MSPPCQAVSPASQSGPSLPRSLSGTPVRTSTVDGFIGFAIGRSIWWDALKGFLADDLERAAAASQIADNYLHFVDVYKGQKVT